MGKLKINGEIDINSYLTASSSLYLSSANSQPIIFRQDNNEIAQFNSYGCLNINSSQSSNTYKLYVNGTSAFQDDSTFLNDIFINNSDVGSYVGFRQTRSTDDKATGVIRYYNCGTTSATSYNIGSFYFVQYSYKSGTYNRLDTYDRYYLPTVASDKTESHSYKILTAKTPVAISEGGTGATTSSIGAFNLLGRATQNGDFNDFIYIGNSWTQLPECINTPFGDNPDNGFGFLEVINAHYGSALQRWTNYNNGDTWVRSNINEWNPWIRYLTSDNYSAYALPLSGGTLTGELVVPALRIKSTGYYPGLFIQYAGADRAAAALQVSITNNQMYLTAHCTDVAFYEQYFFTSSKYRENQ